jgi:hypothetical protein
MTGSHTAAAMRNAMKAARDAFTSMSERAAVVSAKMAMTHHRRATRNIRGATQGHAAAHEVDSPPSEAPAEAAKRSQADGHAEADSNADDHADRNGRHHKSWVGDKQPTPDGPGIVNGNGNQKRIYRRNHDRALLDNYGLLGRRHQHFRRLRLGPQGLDGVHHVFRLVVVGIAELRRPAGVLGEILKNSGKLSESLDGRVPSHVIHGAGALIHGQRYVRDRPGLRSGNLIRKRRACQYLGDQRVRIESDRRHQLIQLLRVQRNVVTRRLLRVQIQLRCIWNQQHGKRERQELARGLIEEIFALRYHRCWVLSHPTARTSILPILSRPWSFV